MILAKLSVYTNTSHDFATTTSNNGRSSSILLSASASSVGNATAACLSSIKAHSLAEAAWYSNVEQSARSGLYSVTVLTITNIYTNIKATYSLSALPTVFIEKPLTRTPSFAFWTSAITSTSTEIYTLTKVLSPSLPSSLAYEAPCYGPQITSSKDCNVCTLEASNVQLIFWPVVTVSGYRNSTITPTASGIQTGYFSGTPYTSGSVYLKYDKADAFNACGMVGKNHSGAIVTLASEQVSSFRGSDPDFTILPVNFADFNYPYDFAAWYGRPDCENYAFEW